MNRWKYHPRVVRIVVCGYLFSVIWGDGFGLKLRVHRWWEPAPFFPAKKSKRFYLNFLPGEWDAIMLAARYEGASAYDFLKHTVMASVNRRASAK